MQRNWYCVELLPEVVKQGDMTAYGVEAVGERQAKILAWLENKDVRWLHNSKATFYSQGTTPSNKAVTLESCEKCGSVHPIQMFTADIIQNKDMEVDEALLCPDCVQIPGRK